jgi:hypothetical protein
MPYAVVEDDPNFQSFLRSSNVFWQTNSIELEKCRNKIKCVNVEPNGDYYEFLIYSDPSMGKLDVRKYMTLINTMDNVNLKFYNQFVKELKSLEHNSILVFLFFSFLKLLLLYNIRVEMNMNMNIKFICKHRNGQRCVPSG